MNHREDWSEAAQITRIIPVASSPAMIVGSLFQGRPAGDLEIDSYLEALLKEDNPSFSKRFK